MSQSLELLKKVIKFHNGDEEYDFSHLEPMHRDNAAFDAWQDLHVEILRYLGEESANE